ncbi:MAG TPA: hypothetical protein GX503_02190 [Clostridiales bacterium]|nr:hypothetical protein [Clostridiales bacterium]
MKLVIAIVWDEDAPALIEELTKQEYRVTKLASTGGFLRAGNTTLLIGTEDEKVDELLDIIREMCKSRKQIVPMPASAIGASGIFAPAPEHSVEVNVGGATIFVVDVDRFEKI